MTIAPEPVSGRLVAFVVVAKLAILALAGSRYGYMSDELYFLDAGQRLAAGYVDFPPLIAWLTGALQALGLDSVVALRSVAALLGIFVTLVGIDLCRLLGGGAFSRWLTALVLIFAPGFLAVQSILTMNGLDQLWWFMAFWTTVRYLQSDAPRYMRLLGLILGLGLLTKLSIAVLCLALPAAALLRQPARLLQPASGQAVLIAVLLALPYLAWQFANEFPFIDFLRAYNSTPPQAMVLQHPVLGMLLTMNPVYAVIWVPGAFYSLLAENRELRLLGTAAWICLALFVLAGVKFYFAVPVFGLFTIAGALAWERLSALWGRRYGRAGLLALGLSGLLSIPVSAPVLPPERLQWLANFLRDSELGAAGDGAAGVERYFPHFAEMHGWPELVELTARVWERMTPEERDAAVLMGSYYGHSAALNQLDDSDRLPQAYGRHMTYHLWSRGLEYPRGLFVGFDETELSALFATVQERGELACELCMSREQGLKLHYVADPRLPAAEIHRRLRRYDFF